MAPPTWWWRLLYSVANLMTPTFWWRQPDGAVNLMVQLTRWRRQPAGASNFRWREPDGGTYPRWRQHKGTNFMALPTRNAIHSLLPPTPKMHLEVVVANSSSHDATNLPKAPCHQPAKSFLPPTCPKLLAANPTCHKSKLTFNLYLLQLIIKRSLKPL